MNERSFDLKREGVGILLFSVAAFFSVLIVKGLSSDVPLSAANGTAVLAEAWIASFGAIPSLVFTAGLAWIGARMFLRSESVAIVRGAGGLAAVALALSVLFGAWSDTAGGKIGAMTGGAITHMTHGSVGAIVGIVAVSAAVWLAWLRPFGASEVDAGAVRGRALAASDDDGVTRDEALALLPDELNRDAASLRKQPVPSSPYPEDVRLRGEIPAGAKPLNPKHAPAQTEDAPVASSVYRWTAAGVESPADAPDADLAVLDELGEPAHEEHGAWRSDERAVESDDPSAVGVGDPRAGETGDVRGGGSVDDGRATREVEELGQPARELDSDVEPRALDAEPELAAQDRFAAEAEAVAAKPLETLPRPSWEQPSLFEEAEEPVDAYGTPLTLIEKLRAANQRTAAQRSETTEPTTVRGDATERAGTPDASDATARARTTEESGMTARTEASARNAATPPADSERAALDREVLAGGARAEAPRDFGPLLDAVGDVVSLEAEAEDDDELDEEDDGEVADVDAEYDEDDADEESDEESDEELESDEDDAELQGADEEDDSDDDEAEVDEPELEETTATAAEAEDDHEDADEIVPAVREKESLQQVIVAPAPRPAARTEPRVPADEPDKAPSRAPTARPEERAPVAPRTQTSRLFETARPRDVVLQPAAAPSVKSAPATDAARGGTRAHADLVREAGALFLDRGRVAVSMLQRQYGMDFDQACALLDELQEMGLIGPYLGGQRRDILLTREQWLEKIASQTSPKASAEA